MFEIMLTLHLLAVIFTIGPLVHAVTTATRGLRSADGAATAIAARMTTIYSYASILVIVFGFGLMSATSPYTGKAVAEFSETWIWLSALLWLISVIVALTVTAPALRKATAQIGSGPAAGGLTGRIAASGGLVAVLFVVAIVLMVYQPGS